MLVHWLDYVRQCTTCELSAWKLLGNELSFHIDTIDYVANQDWKQLMCAH